MATLSIEDLRLDGQRVFMRVDCNVPLTQDGRVSDDTRMRETVPTIEYALRKGARLALACWAGTQIVKDPDGIPADQMGLEIEREAIAAFSHEIAGAKTIVWNGPMGFFEVAPFAKGAIKIAQAVAGNRAATSIVGGGDGVAAVHRSGVADKITHISTGSGASPEFLEGKNLPGAGSLTNQ